MKYRIIPTQDRVLIKVLPEHPDKTPGGIIIPEAVKESPQEIGIVVDVGPGRYTEKGHFVTPTVSIGDKVLYNGMAGSKHNLDNPMGFENYVLIRDSDILAILVDAGEGEVDVTAPGSDYGKTEAVANLDYE